MLEEHVIIAVENRQIHSNNSSEQHCALNLAPSISTMIGISLQQLPLAGKMFQTEIFDSGASEKTRWEEL